MPKVSNRALNFNAGPAALPLEVLKKAQAELSDFKGSGMSLMELSHRSSLFEEVHNQAIQSLKELLCIPKGYDALFLQGGASLQFSMVPMNFLHDKKPAGYCITGIWSEKALMEAKILGNTYEVANTQEQNFNQIPSLDELVYQFDSSYIHLTSNNTIHGTQWSTFPDTKDVPLIADMSSDILSRQIDINQFAMIYAGAQKNLGPSGVTVAIIRQDLIEKANKKIPSMLRYGVHAKNNSLYNTPPTFGIYMLGLMLSWIKNLGGVEAVEKQNQEKAALIYDTIDQSNGFYRGHALPNHRSLMNITFTLANKDLEKKFLIEAEQEGFIGLNGHHLVGGCRASTYNAVTSETCLALREFMLYFQQQNS